MSESNGDFNFDLITRKTRSVQYRGNHYTLRDASEKATIEYEASRWKIEMNGDSIRRVPSARLFESTSVLVSHCLFDKDDKPVPVEALRTWPHEYVEKMYDWVVDNSPGMRRVETRESIEKEIAELQERLMKLDAPTLEEQAKNSPTATGVT